MIEQRLLELIPSRDETLFEAARYALSAGKRIRPLLILSTAAIFDVDPLIALDPACAMEMVHAYSLAHDDLPCMDDDDLRRNKPALHKVYGEAIALLAGNYLLCNAFAVIANATRLEEKQRLQMIQTLASHSSSGLIGGQAIDIESEGKEIDEEILLQMDEKKTSSLFIACFEMGSLAAGRLPTPLLRDLGRDLGLAYQFRDDLLDATSAVPNKHAGSDIIKQKATAITLFGISGTEERLQKLEGSIFERIEQLPHRGGQLIPLIQKMLQKKCNG